MSFISQVTEVLARARKQIEKGAITESYELDRNQVVGILNEALASEIVCVLRYRCH
jgi:bacterioferritin